LRLRSFKAGNETFQQLSPSRTLKSPSKAIQRTLHPAPARPQHVRVNHRRRDIVVAKQLLNRAYVCSTLQRVGREGMAKSMAAGAFGETQTPWKVEG